MHDNILIYILTNWVSVLLCPVVCEMSAILDPIPNLAAVAPFLRMMDGINKDTIFWNKIFLKIAASDDRICHYWISTTQSQAAQNDHYIGYDQRTAKLGIINVQTDQKYSFL